MRYGTALAALSTYTSRQLGLFTRAQARAIGVSDDAVRRLVAASLVERKSPRVFRVTSSARSWHQSVLAACLDGGDECAASHRTAAALHGLDGFDTGGVIEVLVPMKKRLRRSNIVVHHTRAFPDEDRTIAGVIPVTSLARTLLDLGAVVDADRVEDAYDAAERAAPRTRHQVERRYAALRARGRNGIGAMTEIRARRESAERVPRSVLERKMKRLLENARLPDAVSRYILRLPSGRIVELDFAIVEHQLDLEVDGHGSHSTRRERKRDNERAAEIEDAGWRVRRFTYEQVATEPHKVAATIRRAISSRANRI
jgi:very-short-patch-repair endonuclease